MTVRARFHLGRGSLHASRMSLGAAALLLGACAAAAQTPARPAAWTVSIAPTMDPLPAGLCAAVHLTILDATGRDTPRNPAGFRVSLADFDLGISASDPKAVSGYYLDANHWSVCTCQAASVNTVATITATYPARALAERARVAGVTLQTSATFATAAPKGPIDPPSCRAAPTTLVAQSGSPPALIPITGDPAIKKSTEPTPIRRAPRSPTPLVFPTGFRLSSSLPLIATFAWDSMPNAISYSLTRSGAGTPSIPRASVSQSAPKSARDTIPDPRITFHYTLIVRSADGSSAESAAVEFTSPALANPSGFTAQHRGLGSVDFVWRPVAGAVRYRLDGPGLPGTGFYTTDTSTSYPKIPGGANAWKLTALYTGNFADYANPALATAVVRVLPPHTVPWLSKNNGPFSAAVFQAPKEGPMFCGDNVVVGAMDTVFNPRPRWLGDERCYSAAYGLQNWVGVVLPMWADTAEFVNDAVYGNANDLGVGRRAQCAQAVAQAPYDLITTWFATAHGILPGQPGFNNFSTITNPVAGAKEDFILSMVISKDKTGTSFLVVPRDTVHPYGNLSQTVELDTEGPKNVPQVCMSCHGGKYNPITRKVDGASFLPLDPSLLAFASAADQSGQEEKLRKINAMISLSDPTSAVAAYIRGLYGNAVMVPGTLARPDYVPLGWAPQAGFYRSVVKPYCATCHLAAPTSWNFATWQNFNENAALIRAAVCSAHTMPHAELQYKAFWTKDTGSIYTPGLLATVLGFPSCP